MNNEQEHKLEQRIRFVAKHYEEGRLDTDKAWQSLPASIRYAIRSLSVATGWRLRRCCCCSLVLVLIL